MTKRTFTEHLAHLESSRNWKPGDRVRVPGSGRTGILVKHLGRHNGWMVEWDEPKFGVKWSRGIQIANLELIAPRGFPRTDEEE